MVAFSPSLRIFAYVNLLCAVSSFFFLFLLRNLLSMEQGLGVVWWGGGGLGGGRVVVCIPVLGRSLGRISPCVFGF